jgi:1-acyl-sn-glycerol-3-phosphate acyltransferase
MAWRILRVAAFMFRYILGDIAVGLLRPSRRESFRIGAYLKWARNTLETFGVEARVEGRGLVPPSGNAPRVFMCNHQSQLDIPVLVASLGEKIGFVAKKELTRVPILAYWMRQVGCVFIDRADKSGARKSLAAAAASLEGRSLVVFPEGTRSKTGELLPIKSGGLRMAVMAGAQIIPVRLRNTRNAFEARPRGTRVPVPVEVRFFPSLDTRGWPDEKASWLKVKNYLEECWTAR